MEKDLSGCELTLVDNCSLWAGSLMCMIKTLCIFPYDQKYKEEDTRYYCNTEEE